MLIAAGSLSWGQNSNASSHSFEVASVKRSSPDGRFGGRVTNDPLRFSVRRTSLKLLIAMAYGIADFQVVGGPDWAGLTEFDVDATSQGPATRDQQMQMLRTLLLERFHLTCRNETRPFAVYVLTVGKNGPKFGEAFHSPKEGDPRPMPAPGRSALRVTMKQFATLVTQYLKMPFPSSGEVLSPPQELPVVDQTGLTGEYDIVVDLRSNGDWFAALDSQLGLKLEARKTPLDVVVIDKATIPTEN